MLLYHGGFIKAGTRGACSEDNDGPSVYFVTFSASLWKNPQINWYYNEMNKTTVIMVGRYRLCQRLWFYISTTASCLAPLPELPGKEVSVQPPLWSWLPQGSRDLWVMKRLPVSVGVWCKSLCCCLPSFSPDLSFCSDLGYLIKLIFSLEKLSRSTPISSPAILFPWQGLSHPSSPTKASWAWSAPLLFCHKQ